MQCSSNEQRLYANELLNYLNADAQVTNLEDALDDLEDNAKRKILSCIITYMYLYDHTAESMEQDEQEDFIDLFDLGRKTIKSLKQQTVDTYRLRGVDGCIDRYITAPIEITEETPFEVELPEQKTAEEPLKLRPKKMVKKPLTRMRPVKSWCFPVRFRMTGKQSTRIKTFTSPRLL